MTFGKTLRCEYCGEYMGFITIDRNTNILDIQCAKCEVKES